MSRVLAWEWWAGRSGMRSACKAAAMSRAVETEGSPLRGILWAFAICLPFWAGVIWAVWG